MNAISHFINSSSNPLFKHHQIHLHLMKFNLLQVYALFSVALGTSHGVTPEVYWKSELPNSPMPKTVKDLLHNKGMAEHTSQKGKPVYVGVVQPVVLAIPCVNSASEKQLMDNPNVTLFFLENNLQQGVEMKVHFTKNNAQKVTFLPRKVADSISFSSNELPKIYNEFSVKSGSIEAKIMKQTVKDCENDDIQGTYNKCTTSLESMVDFVTTTLGKKVKAVSTEVNAKKSSLLQKYVIERTKKLTADKSVVCHKKNYPYAVFYCHKSISTSAYVVSLLGVDGTKVKAVAVCYTDTAKWNPKLLLFQVLKMKPGSVPVCHFVSEDHVVWVPY